MLSKLSKSLGPLIDASTTNRECEENINVTLKRLRNSDLNNVVFSYLNINSIRNKVINSDIIVDENIDILCIVKKKLDKSFPNNQFAYQYHQSVYMGYYRKQRWLDDIYKITHIFMEA